MCQIPWRCIILSSKINMIMKSLPFLLRKWSGNLNKRVLSYSGPFRSNELLLGPSLLSTKGNRSSKILPPSLMQLDSGSHHKRQRKILNPVFSLKNMRELLPIFRPIAYRVGYLFGH